MAQEAFSDVEAVHYDAVPQADTKKQVVLDNSGKQAFDPGAGIEVAPNHETLPEYDATNARRYPS